MRNGNVVLEAQKKVQKERLTTFVDIKPIEDILDSFSIPEWLLLMSYLDDNGEYMLGSDSHLYFKDCQGYHKPSLVKIEIPALDFPCLKIKDQSAEVKKGIYETTIYAVDVFNNHFNRPENKHRKIKYQKR